MSKKRVVQLCHPAWDLPIQRRRTSGQRLHSLPQRAKARGGYWWHGSGSSAATLLTVTSVFFLGWKKQTNSEDVFLVERTNSPLRNVGSLKIMFETPTTQTSCMKKPPKNCHWNLGSSSKVTEVIHTQRQVQVRHDIAPRCWVFFVGGWCALFVWNVWGVCFLECGFLFVCVCVFDIWSTNT